MSRVETSRCEYLYELLIGALLIAAMLELVLGRDSPAPNVGPLRRPGGGPAGGPALRPQAVSLRGARVLLADRHGHFVRRRNAHPVHGQPLPRRAGRRLPAREPARRQAGLGRPRDRPRRHHHGRLQHPRPPHRRVHRHPRRLRHRLGRGLRATRACAEGRGGRDCARTRPNGTARRPHASRSPRSARGSHASCTTSSPTRSA